MPQSKGPFYMTTAIAYTSGKPHIGNTYEIVLADSIARFRRQEGYDVFFQTGTDEHGQKIELKAEEAGITPKEFVDKTSAEIKRIWDLMNTSYDKFIRTTDDYHEKQVQNSWFTTEDGIILGQKVTALATVGVYVPGGKAVYPSSVLMNVLPAKVAGVDRIVMCTPPGKDGKVYPSTLVAAKEAGVDEIYKVGGAQAIAAMAFGTESVPKVDKIVGPGNIYVALAKKAVFGYVSIDSIAGPSEILVLADETANPRYVAADLLSQAEHDLSLIHI